MGIADKVKGISDNAVNFIEKKTGIDIPEEKVADAVKKAATKENIEKVKDKVEDIIGKNKK